MFYNGNGPANAVGCVLINASTNITLLKDGDFGANITTGEIFCWHAASKAWKTPNEFLVLLLASHGMSIQSALAPTLSPSDNYDRAMGII